MRRRVVSPLILSLLLIGVFSFSTGSSLEHTASVSNQTTASLLSDYENVTIHEGDLVIKWSQTYVIENCTYIQTGNIYVRDNAKLLVRNAEIRIIQSRISEYEFRVEDYATFELEDAVLVSSYGLEFRFVEHSKIILDKVILNIDTEPGATFQFDDYSKADICNFTFGGAYNLGFSGYSEASIANSTIFYIGPAKTAHIQVSNSSILILELWFIEGELVDVNGLKSGFLEYLDLKEKVSSSYHAFDLTLNKTSVNWWLNANYNSKTRISDSLIALFGVDVPPNISIGLEGLEPRFYEFKKVGEITLNRTGITESVRVHMAGAENSICTITNSKVNLIPGCNSRLYITDSVVGWISTPRDGFAGSLHFDNATLIGGISTLYSNFHMDGNLSFSDIAVFWYLSNITRSYGVKVMDAYGNFLPDANLTLESNEVLVWNWFSDSLGSASFSLTFADSNRTDALMLRTFKEGFYNSRRSISLLSSTPASISLTQKPLGDVNEDRVVNIIDISLVAYSFGCVSGDERWNETCDLNKDAEINILDISAAAKDYGKTV